MIPRLSKTVLLLAVALFYLIVVFNNITDYDSNWQFVRHVLAMDSTFPGNHGLWRAMPNTAVETAFYWFIILWEILTCALCTWGGIALLRTLRATPADFDHAKAIGTAGLTLGLLLWFVAFLTVGGEWFLMWQSKIWNGQEAAFRMFTCLALILIYLTMPEPEPKPLR